MGLFKALLLCCFCACALSAQIISIDPTSHAHVDGTSTGVTFSHTVGTGSNRALYVVLAGLTNGPITVTYGGTALTVIADCGNWLCQIWEMKSPPSGTANIVVTWAMDQSYDHGDAAGISLAGVDQTTSVEATAVASAANSASITTISAYDWILGVASNYQAPIVAASGQTEIWNAANYPVYDAAGYYGPTMTTGAQTFGWGGGSTPVGIALAAIKPYVTASAPASASATGSLLSITGTYPRASHPSIPTPSVVLTQYQGAGTGGDTQSCGWTSSSTLAGNFGGGSIVCGYNDGTGLGCASSNICLYKLATYDSTGIVPATTSLLNAMTSYGTLGTYCYSGSPCVHKSRAPFSLPGLIFLPIQGLRNDTWAPMQSGLIVSPDGGAHWCNYLSYATGLPNGVGSSGTANTCTSANWSATGDAPTSSSGYQWPLQAGNKMGELQLVDFLCQDNSINCPVAAGVDPAYLYFFTFDGNYGYIARTLKSLGMAIMQPTNWQIYGGGIWTSAIQSGIGFSGSTSLNPCCSRMAYLKDFGKFVAWPHTDGPSPIPFYYAPYPWGPWTAGTSMAITDNGWQFPSLVGGLCPKYNVVAGHITCTLASNLTGGANLYLREIDLGTIGKPLMGIK